MRNPNWALVVMFLFFAVLIWFGVARIIHDLTQLSEVLP